MIEFTWRILLVGRALQQLARIPVFDAGRVLGIEPDAQNPSAGLATVAIPRIDLIAQKCTVIAYNAALDFVTWAAAHYRPLSDLTKLYELIEEKALKPLRSIVPVGISTVPILNQAYLQHIPFRHLGAGVYQLGYGARSRITDRSSVAEDSAIGSKLVQKKHWTAQILRSAGLPAPLHTTVSNASAALQAAEKLGWPIVVKPVDRDRSEGVTVGINDAQKLSEAFKFAAGLTTTVLIEREVPGICYRLLVANGELLYALSRKPKSVTGDGTHTIAELVQLAFDEARKKPSWSRSKPIRLDDLAFESIAEQGLTAESIPEAGVKVALRRIESSEWGGNIEDATGDVHPDNAELAVRAARLFGLTNAGIDIISVDIARPWHENGAVINEVNYAPYFGGNPTAKAKLPVYFQGLIQGEGRIPIEVFLGGEEAMKAGKFRHAELLANGVGCFLTSHGETLTNRGNAMPFPEPGLFDRTFALLMNREVEALILVVQTDELLQTGLPVDRLDKIHLTPGVLFSARDGQPLSSPRTRQQLLELLRLYENGAQNTE
ncbi:hypothetical protein [Candidatus Methylomicrobium oryzae]|uniref:hypothetical protein n=1 Tax=Candidatus Methylomicrobium oryzae TaxID=2802053 RepID=UPI0019215EA0|nr:hypothetical protein [Methylomicrobium sp. RS1]MBL1264245.1 hypothetical protein [Methylomicrobium sp. RS1]